MKGPFVSVPIEGFIFDRDVFGEKVCSWCGGLSLLQNLHLNGRLYGYYFCSERNCSFAERSNRPVREDVYGTGVRSDRASSLKRRMRV